MHVLIGPRVAGAQGNPGQPELRLVLNPRAPLPQWSHVLTEARCVQPALAQGPLARMEACSDECDGPPVAWCFSTSLPTAQSINIATWVGKRVPGSRRGVRTCSVLGPACQGTN